MNVSNEKTIQLLKEEHEKRQIIAKDGFIIIREGIELEVGHEDYPRFGYEFFCWRDEYCVNEMDMFLKYSIGKKNLFDIGAAHGIFSFVFIKTRENAKALAFDIDENNIETIIKFDNGGDVLPLLVNVSNNVSDNRISIDYFCDKTNAIPDVLKIDVEGNELDVIKGAINTIKKYNPIIFLEIHKTLLMGGELEEMLSIFKEFNYSIIDSYIDKEVFQGEVLNSKLEEIRIILIPSNK